MESHLLERTSLNHLEFTTETNTLPSGPTLPDQIPSRPDLRHLPIDVLTSSTVENLISQNEDLMARLKVALRRLSTLELENTRLQDSTRDAQKRSQLADDQVGIFKEKDSAWKLKFDAANFDRAAVIEKLNQSETQLKAAQQALHDAETDRIRLKRYQDKIRHQIKPHLVELKEYAKGLEVQIQELKLLSSEKDVQIQSLKTQILTIVENAKGQTQDIEKRLFDMTQLYETETRHLRSEKTELQTALNDLEIRIEKLRKSEQRCDYLENEVIELRRQKELMLEQLEDENSAWIKRMESTQKDSVRLKIENEDLRAKTLTDYDKIRSLEKQQLDLQSQLESLRFLWQNRQDENERLSATVTALEKLNVELSKKIQERRAEESKN